jgi:thiosulfate dehydrogenase
VSERLTLPEQKIADIETAKFIDESKEIFHSSDKLGGTIGISCDMCHPDTANTHPKTCPKYQTRLQRVVLLRDMINWCIENPVKGQPFNPDDPRLRALEAYIISQRNGTALAYGKH